MTDKNSTNDADKNKQRNDGQSNQVAEPDKHVGATAEEGYTEDDLKPGGRGKSGDQQQFGEDREKRKDKSHSAGGGDKLHGK